MKDLTLVLMTNGTGITEPIVTWYILDIRAEDTKRYFNIGTCHSLIANINSTSFASFFRCSPELDSGNSWYQEMAIMTKYMDQNEGSSKLSWTNISDNNSSIGTNITLERNTIATATVNFPEQYLELKNSFLFLQSSLFLGLDSIIKSIKYSQIKDISAIKKAGEYVVLSYIPPPEAVEGEMLSIGCYANGRNPPALKLERNGMTIIDTDDVYISSIKSPQWTTYEVTYLHATEEIEGNYSCVIEDGSQKTLPLFDFQLKPKIRWDLMQEFNTAEEVR